MGTRLTKQKPENVYYLESGDGSYSGPYVNPPKGHNIVQVYKLVYVGEINTAVKKNDVENLTEGTVVVATYGFNDILKKPFEFLYEFGYYTKYGCVVYQQGERNMQDSCAFKLEQIRVATKEDLTNYYWGK